MELLKSAISILDQPTCELNTKTIQEILLAVKKNRINNGLTEDYYKKILEKLWHHLTTELKEFDDQLLCSTCFYSLLSNFNNPEYYLEKIFEIIHNDNKLKENDIEKGQKLSLSVSLSYGIFQSSYLLQRKPINILQNILKEIFQLLLNLAYEYSQHSFIAFKIMVSLKKVINTEFQDVLFNAENQIKLLNVVNHNWENPITGVRSQVSMLFRTILSVLDNYVYETVLKEINNFYWNKAKFLMLAEIIDHFNGNIEDLVLKNDWLDCLVYSLSKPGLVSAGADMYNAVIKKINSDNVWKSLFLQKVIKVLHGSFKAIENFSNYWCLNTLRKFPSLAKVLIETLNIDYSENKLYSIMCIMKQGNKLGLIERNWNSSDVKDEIVSRSLDHCNTHIRSLAFEIICVTQGKCFPTSVEYNYILNYLKNNVNSDCTVLRISMLNNLSVFLTQLHMTYLNNLNTGQDIDNLKDFIKNLQQFVIDSLILNGNYQRKITSIKLAHILLKSFNEIPRKRLQQTRKINKPLVMFLKENDSWLLNTDDFIMKLISLLKDPANDVQYGTLQILTEFYSKELSDTVKINYLIQEGFECLKSKFFYEINCGLIIFKVVINIIIVNENSDCRFKTIEDIYEFAYNEITQEFISKQNIVQSIEKGKQLHSFLNLLFLIFEYSTKNSYKLDIRRERIISLLDMVQHISNQFDWEDESQTSSDFSKINDMVESLIKNSGLEFENIEDEAKISGLHQIVLNCLWLNVKASCDLASILVQNYTDDINICKKCLDLITHVLETSRHKGAIEAAGAALGEGINFLTSLKEEPEISKLPLNLLKDKLKELLFETTKMSSVTRRGAGLSIMVHRIVSNDVKKGKPLFHYFMKTLLNVCATTDDTCNGKTDIVNEKDLPKAIYIHFLTRIVTDSSLASDMMYYSTQLAALAFNNLTNSHWQIRNAALQLYGALIPKLIGQKKASGTDDETMATVACDEFRKHSPKLWHYIVEQIENQNHKDIILAHSNLVPILNVLSSIARRYNFSYDLKEEKKYELSLFLHLFNLLGSPIYTVRRLTSQSITNIYSFETIYETIIKNEIFSENYLHGIILLLSSCHKVYYKTSQKQINSLIEKYKEILMVQNHSYICKWNLEKLMPSKSLGNVNATEDVLNEAKHNRYEPGVSLWANLKIQNLLKDMQWKNIPDTLNVLSDSLELEIYCETLIERIQKTTDPPKAELTEIAYMLLQCNIISKSSAVWKILYYISQKVDLQIDIHNTVITQLINKPSYMMRYIVPFAALYFSKDNQILQVSKTIFALCNPEYNDVDMRYIAAISNNELAFNFPNYNDDVKINAIKSAIILLQDEDEDIRNLSVIFYKNLMKDSESKQPYICLQRILNRQLLNSILQNPESSVTKICEDLFYFIDSISSGKSDLYNPFANDAKNVYLEMNVFRKSLQELNTV